MSCKQKSCVIPLESLLKERAYTLLPISFENLSGLQV